MTMTENQDGVLQALEETKATISLHGLGFLQIKLGGGQRLHVWHPALPRRSCFAHSQIHDHRFGFTSQVLVGEQMNVTYAALKVEGADPLPEEAAFIAYSHDGGRGAHGNRPWTPVGRYKLVPISREIVAAGESYSMLPYVFHASYPKGGGKTATLMTKTQTHERGATSLCKEGVLPDTQFNRAQLSDVEMWDIVADVLLGSRFHNPRQALADGHAAEARAGQ